jgi:hypothetical protein
MTTQSSTSYKINGKSLIISLDVHNYQKVEEKWGMNHLPCHVLALYKHPETGIDINENKSSTITEHWNVQSDLRAFEMGTDGKLMEIDDRQNSSKPSTSRESRFVSMYHEKILNRSSTL